MIYALAVVVLTLVALNKLPYPGAKPVLPSGPVTAAMAATIAPPKAAEPAVVAKPEPPRIQYVSTRECSRTAWGNRNCTEITTVKH
ncbi:hypothetical protein CH341_01790 [Rhodoplanes roseus]|uniref:Uncharacterized protein n=2 Tax=Rhodoplanes roseus TaxID=29409 RepID=A0A327LDH1_9BRAD|nr:hypothetical protein CH341_01790 [Rhodoplanes roseus]